MKVSLNLVVLADLGEELESGPVGRILGWFRDKGAEIHQACAESPFVVEIDLNQIRSTCDQQSPEKKELND